MFMTGGAASEYKFVLSLIDYILDFVKKIGLPLS